MIYYCRDKWNKNKKRLQEALKDDRNLEYCEYIYLVQAVVKYILNDETDDIVWDDKKITVVDNGDYQGTQLFIIPAKAYQPSEYEYLMTFVNYGSCSVCDTLLQIQMYQGSEKQPTKEALKNYMLLCKELVCNMVKPFKCGWRDDGRFAEVSYEMCE